MQTQTQFQLVHPSEVAAFFQRIGLIEEFVEGQIQCNFCHDFLTSESFKAATRQEGKLLFVCDKPRCYTAFLDSST